MGSVRMAPVVRILDGGLSTALEKSGYEISGDPLWSARLLATDPACVVAAHEKFVHAGADVITTASYQASVDGFIKHLGLKDPEPAMKLIASSVDLARQAVRNCGKEGKGIFAPASSALAGLLILSVSDELDRLMWCQDRLHKSGNEELESQTTDANVCQKQVRVGVWKYRQVV